MGEKESGLEDGPVGVRGFKKVCRGVFKSLRKGDAIETVSPSGNENVHNTCMGCCCCCCCRYAPAMSWIW